MQQSAAPSLEERPTFGRLVPGGARSGTLIGGLFNRFRSFSQNVGLVGLTGVRSRFVCGGGGGGGGIMMLPGLLPRLA